MSKVRVAAVLGSAASYLAFASNAFAQVASTGSANFGVGVGGGSGTASSLPNAGSTDLTYAIFLGGAVLFVFGMIKLVSSYKD